MDRTAAPRFTEPLTVTHRFVGEIAAVHVVGSMVAETSGPVVTELVTQLLADGCRKFVLNLTEVPSCDTRGLAALVMALTQVEETDGALALAQVQPRVMTVLETTGLLAVFDVYEAEREAVASLRTTPVKRPSPR